MGNDLEDLVKKAHTDIAVRTDAPVVRGPKNPLPKLSVAALVWLSFVILLSSQFDTFTAIFSAPAEAKIERDLETILNSAAKSLESYESINRVLPPILPNPAIRGLVLYERQSDFGYTLTATIHNVTMVKTSTRMHPFRQDADK